MPLSRDGVVIALARWILRVLMPAEYRDVVLADIEEEFGRRREHGRLRATLWYWGEVLHVDVLRLRRTAVRQDAGGVGGRVPMSDVVSIELRQALRVFRRSPGFVATVVATLAIGIGGVITVFTVINSLLLRPLPGIVEAERIVALEASEGGGAFGVSSYMDYLDFAERTRGLVGMAAFKPRRVETDVDEGGQSVDALMVTSSYFDVLGVRPYRGTFFTRDVDTGPGAHPLAILTAGFWQRAFASDREILGASIVLNGQPYTVVGITPPEFVGTQIVDAPDLFVPITMQPALMPESGYLLDRRGWGGIQQIGRLGPGTSFAAAEREILAVASQLQVDFPNTNASRDYRVLSFREAALPGQLRSSVVQMSVLLMAVVFALWLVVCLNVSNLQLARSLKRRHELSIRAALGAGRGRIGMSVMLEFFAIAMVAGLAGTVVSRVLATGISTMPLPILLDTSLDVRTMVFAGCLAAVTAVVCALVPSVAMSGADPRDVRSGTRASQKGSKRWASRALIVGQVSVSVVLLFGTALFVRSLVNLTSVDPGFDSSNLATARVSPGLQGYAPDELVRYYARLTGALEAIPGVATVTMAGGLPSNDNFGRDSWFFQNADDLARGTSLFLNLVSVNYFGTLGIPIIEGRGFSDVDTADQPLVVVVNQATARIVESRTGSAALGQRIGFAGPDGPFLEIVGIVGDSRTSREAQASPFVYGAHEQVVPLGLGGERMVVMLKTTVAPETVMADFRRVARSVDPRVSAADLVTMEAFLADLLVADRIIVLMLGASSLLAVLLVAIGVYGLLTYVVGQRTREFGIRLALGARAAVVRGLVVREALALAVVGLALGGVGALALMRAVQDQLFEVTASDPVSLAVGAGAVVAVMLLAAYVPARRAMRLDPLIAIRAE